MTDKVRIEENSPSATRCQTTPALSAKTPYAKSKCAGRVVGVLLEGEDAIIVASGIGGWGKMQGKT